MYLFHEKEILYHHPLQFNYATSASARSELDHWHIRTQFETCIYVVYKYVIKRVNKAFLTWKIRKVYDTTT